MDLHIPNDQRFKGDEHRVEDKLDDVSALRKDVETLNKPMDNTQGVCEGLARQLAELQT